MVQPLSHWVEGPARSGKTTTLLAHLEQWHQLATRSPAVPQTPVSGAQVSSAQVSGAQEKLATSKPGAELLIFAATGDNRALLAQKLLPLRTRYGSVQSTTPLAFFEREVFLFWPLLIPQLNLPGFFPCRLRPETEQELAIKLWGTDRLQPLQNLEAVSVDRWVRRILDCIQLAGASGTSLTQISSRLLQAHSSLNISPEAATLIQDLCLEWQAWCLARGLLTYGLITDVFGQVLLPNPLYQERLRQRFWAIAADDVDSYPAIMSQLFQHFFAVGVPGFLTFNPEGSIRKGLGADPEALMPLKQHCQVIALADAVPSPASRINSDSFDSFQSAPSAVSKLLQTILNQQQPTLTVLQADTRIQLLHNIAAFIATSVAAGQVHPQEIAIIGPGLDSIARYTLTRQLQDARITVESLRDQRPLQSSALVRALLTLLALVYPGLGHFLAPEDVAEMLVVLTATDHEQSGHIDPVRAGLLADFCFRPHPQKPELLPIETFNRWDRLGAKAVAAYQELCTWIQQQQRQFSPALSQPEASPPHAGGGTTGGVATGGEPTNLTLSPAYVIDRAIQTFLLRRALPSDRLAVLRELMETAQHYWEIDSRLRKTEATWISRVAALANFIQLLRRGVITANPYPTRPEQMGQTTVVLATTYQYLSARLAHPWQFWLDSNSALWQSDHEVQLWGAAQFWQTPAPLDLPGQADRQLAVTLRELLRRSQQQVFLCQSELAANGQIQTGPLTIWADAAQVVSGPINQL